MQLSSVDKILVTWEATWEEQAPRILPEAIHTTTDNASAISHIFKREKEVFFFLIENYFFLSFSTTAYNKTFSIPLTCVIKALKLFIKSFFSHLVSLLCFVLKKFH